jgi:hypothetical protein
MERDALIEAIGLWADSIDSALIMSKAPLPASIHVEGLTGTLRRIGGEMRATLLADPEDGATGEPSGQ